MFSPLAFRHPFRKYQRMILAQVEAGETAYHGTGHSPRYHIVAPPGAGKTIIGLELIRRFGAPAVVFAPTTTIQAQWREKAALFLPDGADLDALTSLEATRLAPINVFTYQLISTPGESQKRVEAMALQKWVDDLTQDGISNGESAALERLEALRVNNPRAYRSELARRYLRIKHTMLRSGQEEIGQFLHPNARQLIQSLVGYGVRTVVLDECHHLLDYWAIVLRSLIERIPGCRVIGLTATLPSPEDDLEYENYTSLLGDVDFEVPTPAVVKEGDLAPYRDLIYFVRPNRRETEYLKHIQAAFEHEIAALTGQERFRRWVEAESIRRPPADGQTTEAAWEETLNQSPLFCLAALRFLRQNGVRIPAGLTQPLEAEEPLALDDWLALLDRYALNVLKLSPNEADHRQLQTLRKSLLPFGLTLTERGLRQGRSAGDLVLAFSESKDGAAIHILREEFKAMGEKLRAVVVTDFERMSSGVKPLKNVLDPDAGSAIRVFHALVSRPELDDLDAVLVTGKTLMIDANHRNGCLAWFNDYLRRQNLNAVCHFRETASPRVLEVTGEGKDWSSRVYVGMVTAALEAGLTRCLVGTRGIFGEGWDSLSLNTLIDLTSVTTSTSVQQLRGRSIRKDPSWPQKLAHNWDVICVAPQFEKGDSDLKRLVQRHGRYWGVVPATAVQQALQDTFKALPAGKSALEELSAQTFNVPPARGQIVKGLMHLDPDLPYELCTRGLKKTDFDRYTRRSLAAVGRRELSYALWGIGEEYSNFSYSATRLDVSDLKIRTVWTVTNTLKAMLRQFVATLLGTLMTVLYFSYYAGSSFYEAGGAGVCLGAAGIVLAAGTFIAFLANLGAAYQLARKFLVEQPPDAILFDVGRALLVGLRQAGLVSRNLSEDYVRVIEHEDKSCEVLLDYASPEDAALFIQAYQEIFEPVRDQRYLILRDDERLPAMLLMPLWRLLRNWLRDTGGYAPAYHPVPKALSTRKGLAEAFAAAWEHYVGGGQLVFTRNETGRRMLLHARTQHRPKAKGMAFEIWR
ncbi:MAG: DEAD/DEAH box helicase family protein [Chloroflexota bacterium]